MSCMTIPEDELMVHQQELDLHHPENPENSKNSKSEPVKTDGSIGEAKIRRLDRPVESDGRLSEESERAREKAVSKLPDKGRKRHRL